MSRLRVGNEDFLVSSMIERCPKFMMLRELVKNAIEAAANAPEGERRVEIGPMVIGGQRKLCIWNTGPGMDAAELRAMCDIASSIGKQNALDQNFGMGAKVASLPSNQHGIRYRSCKNGVVHQVVMGKRDGKYGRLLQRIPSGEMVEAAEVSKDAVATGRSLAYDWTEVILYGQKHDQDTVTAPYAGDPVMPPGWIADTLYKRFFSLPPDIKVVLKDGCNIRGGNQLFQTMAARIDRFSRYEAVPVENGLVIHYLYDAPDPKAPGGLASARDALQPAQSTAGLIYQDEFYDTRLPWAWVHEAPVFGIPFGAKNISVFVELPKNFPLLPDGYRQFLRHNHNLQHQVQTREFAHLVLRNRPAWLLELLRSLAPDAAHVDHLHGEMASLFRTLGVRRRWWPPGMAPKTQPGPGGGVEYEVAPEIMPLRDPADIKERGLDNKAARFYPEAHQLFINTTYSSFINFAQTLEAEFATLDDQERLRRAALQTAEHLLTLRICRKLVYGLAKRDVWQRWEVDQATSMYALTVAADDHVDALDEAREEMRDRLSSAQTLAFAADREPELAAAR